MENLTNDSYGRYFSRNERTISDETLYTTKIIFGMILLTPVSVLGIVGNIISLNVLRHQKGKTASIYCLIALSVSDLLLLMNALLFSAINIYVHFSPIEGTNFRNSLFPYFGIYFSLVTARITSLLTTLLSIERFVAVYFPMKAKFICNKKTTSIAIFIIYIITTILFLPFSFKYKVKDIIKNNVTLTIVVRNPSLSASFCNIYGIAMNCIFRFFPILLIFVLNIAIIWIIRQTRQKRQSLTSPYRMTQSYEQRKITLMLLVVSFTFLICILPGAINSLLQTIWEGYSRLGKSKNFQQFFSYISFFLEALNSAVNFIIYMAFSAKFRAVYREIYVTAKTFVREVSVHSFSRKHSSFAFPKILENQGSLKINSNSHTNQQENKDLYKSLLQNSDSNGQSSEKNGNNSANVVMFELTDCALCGMATSRVNSRSLGFEGQSENSGDISRDLQEHSNNDCTAYVAKFQPLETNVDGL